MEPSRLHSCYKTIANLLTLSLLAMLVVSKEEFNHFDTTNVYTLLLRSVVMQ